MFKITLSDTGGYDFVFERDRFHLQRTNSEKASNKIHEIAEQVRRVPMGILGWATRKEDKHRVFAEYVIDDKVFWRDMDIDLRPLENSSFEEYMNAHMPEVSHPIGNKRDNWFTQEW